MNNEVESGDTARDLLESIVLWVESTALEHRIPATVKHARRFLDRTERAQPVEAVGGLAATTFICHLIDNHEGEKVTEESLQSWLAEALANPRPTGDAVLDTPALIGNTQFGKGIPWATVIACAQRHYQHKDDPTPTPEQIAKFRDALLTAGNTAPTVEQAGEVVAWQYRSPAQVEFGRKPTLTEDAELVRLMREAGDHEIVELVPAAHAQPRPVGVPDGEVARLREALEWIVKRPSMAAEGIALNALAGGSYPPPKNVAAPAPEAK